MVETQQLTGFQQGGRQRACYRSNSHLAVQQGNPYLRFPAISFYIESGAQRFSFNSLAFHNKRTLLVRMYFKITFATEHHSSFMAIVPVRPRQAGSHVQDYMRTVGEVK